MGALSVILGDRRKWTPQQLGGSLLAWWDADRVDLITQSGELISSWKDSVGGYDAIQASAGAKPAFLTAGFKGRPGAVFDGVDDELMVASIPGSFPLNDAPGEIWLLADQTALPADTGQRVGFSYGGTNGATSRRAFRSVISGANRASGTATSPGVSHSPVDLSGRHVMRFCVSDTDCRMDVDGVTGPAAAGVATGAVAARARLGASNGTSASLFWQGMIAAALVTAPLSAAQADQMYAVFNRRL